MLRLRFTSAALEDLADIAAYITQVSGDRKIAENFTSQLRQQCAKLASLPGALGRARPELRTDIRSFAFKGYVIFFRYQDGHFEVINLLEGHRDIAGYYKDSDN